MEIDKNYKNDNDNNDNHDNNDISKNTFTVISEFFSPLKLINKSINSNRSQLRRQRMPTQIQYK